MATGVLALVQLSAESVRHSSMVMLTRLFMDR